MTTDEKERLKQAAKAAFGGIDGITGIGVNDRAVVVFVRDREVLGRLPTMFADLPVQGIVTGRITAAAENAH